MEIRHQQLDLDKIKRNINRLIDSMASDISEDGSKISRRFEDSMYEKLGALVAGGSANMDNDALSVINNTASLLLSEYKNNIMGILKSKVQSAQGSDSEIPVESLMSIDLSEIQISGLNYNLDLNSMGHEYDGIIKTGVIAVAAVATVAAAVATVTVLIITWVRYKKPDVSMSLNGSLAGLVAITAGCDTVSPTSAAIIGIISGFVVVFGIEFIDKVLKVDDPVGAVGVHGLNGAFGTLAVGLFSDGTGTEWKGLLVGGGFHGFGVQFIGMLITIAWVAVTMTIIFQAIKHTVGLRVTAEEEIEGLDSKEHGLTSAYDGFVVHDTMTVPTPMGVAKKSVSSNTSANVAPAEVVDTIPDLPREGVHKLTKVVIITRQSKLEEFMHAMNEIGVTGITITNVMGCGVQKGARSYYRGVEMDMNLLPKIKIEIVVSLVPVKTVIDTAKKVLHTGQYGDGKVFVYDIENVVKIRTGEEGFEALQDTQPLE